MATTETIDFGHEINKNGMSREQIKEQCDTLAERMTEFFLKH